MMNPISQIHLYYIRLSTYIREAFEEKLTVPTFMLDKMNLFTSRQEMKM